MKHLLPFVLCLAGFALLASATHRQQVDLFGRALSRRDTLALRIAGALVLTLAMGLLVDWQGWSLGLTIFSGHTSLAAGIVYCTLVGYGRSAPRVSKR